MREELERGKFFGLIFGLVRLFGVFWVFLSRDLEFRVLIRCYGNQVLRKIGE